MCRLHGAQDLRFRQTSGVNFNLDLLYRNFEISGIQGWRSTHRQFDHMCSTTTTTSETRQLVRSIGRRAGVEGEGPQFHGQADKRQTGPEVC